MKSDEIEVVKSFIAAINERNVSRLIFLMAGDHTFIDSGGTVQTGRDTMKTGWEQYFRMFPDFTIEIQDIFHEGDLVAVFGRASGTYNGKRGMVPQNRIEMPGAWKAIVRNGKILHWQVYADWTEGSRVIAEDSGRSS